MLVTIVLLIMMMLLILILIVSLHMYRTAKLDRVLYQELYFPELPKSFEHTRIFFISDIHRRIVSDRIIESVRNQADFVIIGGDLTEKNVALSRVEQNIVKLKSVGPVYFVWGNNDYEADATQLEELLVKHDVTMLTNRSVTVTSNKGSSIRLIGIDDIAMDRDDLHLALTSCSDQDCFRLLVSHNPLVKKQLREEHGISLVLSGHTHGGQVRIWGYGPYRLGGIDVNDGCLYVTSNGYGTSTVPFRLGAKPETHVFCLKKGHHTGVGEVKVLKE